MTGGVVHGTLTKGFRIQPQSIRQYVEAVSSKALAT